VGDVIAKLVRHVRAGTLVSTAKAKLRLMRNRGPGDDFYGDRAAGYEAKRAGQQYWDDQQKIAEELIESFPNGSTVLDVPFGTGRFVDVYNRKAMKVAGLEVSGDMLRSARDLRGDAIEDYDLRVGDARSLPWPDGTFDLVATYRFLPSIISIADQRIVLSEIHRVTRDAALLDVGVRDPEIAPLTRPPRESERSGLSFHEPEVRRMLNDAGFEVEDFIEQYRWMDDGFRYVAVCRKR
jgi:ubiquinone/menaquinone biosynthesis C-methylase UbiE